MERQVTFTPMRRDEQPGLKRGHLWLVPGGSGQQTSRHANPRPASLPLSSEQQQRHLWYTSVVNGRHRSGHTTSHMSTGVTVSRPSSGGCPVQMDGRRERLNVSVLKLAGFEGPKLCPVSRLDNLRPQRNRRNYSDRFQQPV